MPPLKEYKFENMLNANIVITIKAYHEHEAFDLLRFSVSDSLDYKRIN